MSERSVAFAKNLDEPLENYLTQSGVEWIALERHDANCLENTWLSIYGYLFKGRYRMRVRAKAEYEYQFETATHYLIVRFSANVPGLAMNVRGRQWDGYECRGPLVPLGEFCDDEFFICPLDFSWTMVHTHEDYAYGGPFFIRREWLPGG